MNLFKKNDGQTLKLALTVLCMVIGTIAAHAVWNNNDYPYLMRFTRGNRANNYMAANGDNGILTTKVRVDASGWRIEWNGDKTTFQIRDNDGRLIAYNGDRYIRTTDNNGGETFKFRSRWNGQIYTPVTAANEGQALNPDGGTGEVGKQIARYDWTDGGSIVEFITSYPTAGTYYRIRFTNGLDIDDNGAKLMQGNYLQANHQEVKISGLYNQEIGSKGTILLKEILWEFVPSGTNYRLKSLGGLYLKKEEDHYVTTRTEAEATLFNIRFYDDNEKRTQIYAVDGNAHMAKNGNSIKADNNANAADNEVEIIYDPSTEYLTKKSDKVVKHRANYMVEKADNSWPVGFLTKDSGLDEKGLQKTSVFEVTNYIHPETPSPIYMPTRVVTANFGDNRHRTYQRWFDYDNEQNDIKPYLDYESPKFEKIYKNGVVMGISMFGTHDNNHDYYVDEKAFVTLPEGTDNLTLALDMSRYEDFEGNFKNDEDLTEPSLTMRAIWHVKNANTIATELKNRTFEIEKSTIHFPEYSVNYDNDRLPLKMELSNYWVYNSDNTLVSAGREGGYRIEITQNAPGIQLGGRLDVLNKKGTNDYLEYTHGGEPGDGLCKYIWFNQERHNIADYGRSRFIEFFYPNNGRQVNACGPENPAVIKVWARNNDGQEFQIAEFTVIFDKDEATLPRTDIIGKDTGRSPRELKQKAGNPVATITFNTPDTPGNDYKLPTKGQTIHQDDWYPDGVARTYNGSTLPLDFQYTSYAYDFGWSRPLKSWFVAEWGEYAIVDGGNGTNEDASVLGKPVNYGDDTSADLGITRMPTERFLYIDASENPGKVAGVPFEGVFCQGKLLCSGWITCANQYNVDIRQVPGSIILTMRGLGYDGQWHTIHQYCPGQIRKEVTFADGRQVNPGDEDPWQHFYFEFSLEGQSYERFELVLENNCVGSHGGDYMLDDICVYALTPNTDVPSMMPECFDTEEFGRLNLLRLESNYEGLLAAYDGQSEADVINQMNRRPLAAQDTDGWMGDEKVIAYAFINKKIFLETLEREIKNNIGSVAGFNWEEWIQGEKADGKLPEDATIEDLLNKGYLDFQDYAYTYEGTKTVIENAYKTAFNAAIVGDKDKIWDAKKPEENTGAAFLRFYWSNYINDVNQFTFEKVLENDEIVYQDINAEGAKVYVFNAGAAKVNFPTLEENDSVVYYVVADLTGYMDNNAPVYAKFNLTSDCTKKDFFTLERPVAVVKLDAGDTNGDRDVCENSYPNVAVEIKGFKSEGEPVTIKKENIYYDWWTGTATAPATLANFNADANLSASLSAFRAAYPYATTLDGLAPTEDFTQEMIDRLKALENNGTLILRKNTFNADYNWPKAFDDPGTDPVRQAHYLVAVPIVDNEFTQNVTDPVYDLAFWCEAPQAIKIYINPKTTTVKSGFDTDGETVYNYGDETDGAKELSVRMARKSQFNLIRHGNITDADNLAADAKTLLLPLREASSYFSDGITRATHLKRAESTGDYNIYLVGTTDSDIDIDQYRADNEDEYPVVGRIVALNAIDMTKAANAGKNPNAENYLRIYFFNDFAAHEGCNYRLMLPFEEKEGGQYQCPGQLYINLKIVPDYQVWTGGAGNTDWNNDQNWRRADRSDLYADNGNSLKSEDDSADNGYISNAANNNSYGFAPLNVTSILTKTGESATATDAANLYDAPIGADNFPSLNEETATPILKYDFIVRDWRNTGDAEHTNLDAHGRANDLVSIIYKPNVCKQIAMQPQTELLNSQLLTYQKAWVEYALQKGRWYLLGSPLQNMLSGDWYAPSTPLAQQQTTYYEDITFDADKHDRYAPAIYQRNWDQANAILYEIGAPYAADQTTDARNEAAGNTAGTPDQGYLDAATSNWVTTDADEYLKRIVYQPINGTKTTNVAIRGTWSSTYNDAMVRYDKGGFSTLVLNNLKDDQYTDQTDQDAIIRLPKEDTSYNYYEYDQNGTIGTNSGINTVLTADETAKRHKLRTDGMTATGFTVAIRNSGSTPQVATGKFLVGNPFVCGLDMDQFFNENNTLAKSYYLLDAQGQKTIVYNNTSGNWEQDGTAIKPLVQPGQGFFITNAGATELTVTFTPAMMTSAYPKSAPAPARHNKLAGQQTYDGLVITAERDQLQSTAVLTLDGGSSNHFVVNEDVETFIDDNVKDAPTVYTLCGRLATTVNRLSNITSVPLGIESAKSSTTKVTFNGVESVGDSLQLYDAQTGETTDLYDGLTVEMPGKTQMRYFIISGGINQREAVNESNLQLWTESHAVNVKSTTGADITLVRAFDSAGRLLYSAEPGSAEHRFTLSAKGVVVVEARTADSQKRTKLMIY